MSFDYLVWNDTLRFPGAQARARVSIWVGEVPGLPNMLWEAQDLESGREEQVLGQVTQMGLGLARKRLLPQSHTWTEREGKNLE